MCPNAVSAPEKSQTYLLHKQRCYNEKSVQVMAPHCPAGKCGQVSIECQAQAEPKNILPAFLGLETEWGKVAWASYPCLKTLTRQQLWHLHPKYLREAENGGKRKLIHNLMQNKNKPREDWRGFIVMVLKFFGVPVPSFSFWTTVCILWPIKLSNFPSDTLSFVLFQFKWVWACLRYLQTKMSYKSRSSSLYTKLFHKNYLQNF